MENKHIIIILVIVIVALAAGIGVMLFNQSFAKNPTVVDITSDKKQTENSAELAVKLQDVKDNPVSCEIVNVKITDKNGKVVVDDVVKTNSKGKAKLSLDLKNGKYNVEVVYGGNDNYTGDNATQKLTIKEEEVAEAASEPAQSQPSVYAYQSDGTPMYSQAEVDSYMYNKYGLVNYHIKENRYIDMDEPGFDDKGNYIGY